MITVEGSPPLVRERLRSWLSSSLWRRITPACAGTTGVEAGKNGVDGDHPRLCGNDLLQTERTMQS